MDAHCTGEGTKPLNSKLLVSHNPFCLHAYGSMGTTQMGLCLHVNCWTESKHGWMESRVLAVDLASQHISTYCAYCDGQSLRQRILRRVQTRDGSSSLLRKIKQHLRTKAQGWMGPLWIVKILLQCCFTCDDHFDCCHFSHISSSSQDLTRKSVYWRCD